MWLWKKFWNTDIIGKIYILIILFIVVVATISVVTRYKNADTNQVVNNEQNEIIENVVTSEEDVIGDKTIILADTSKETEEIKQEIKEETLTINTSKNNTDTQKSEPTKSEDVKQTSYKKETEVTTIADSVSDVNVPVDKQIVEEVKQEKLEEEKETKEDAKEETKEETVQEEITEEITEEYRENTNLINTMKNYIINNPSADMKAYGFEVVVDSSIVELTNQFTYTEQRMRDQLKWRFGTIKIYARDYYYNGEFVITQCFIL